MEGREGLWLSAEQRGSLMVVTIRGDLDIVSSGRFDDCLKQAHAVSKRIILDLAGVDFMDTSALAVIVGHWKKLKAEGGTLVLAGARYRYTKSLWITGLADRLPLYDTVELAIAARGTGRRPPGRRFPGPGARWRRGRGGRRRRLTCSWRKADDGQLGSGGRRGQAAGHGGVV